jgi:hypothetical protein
LDAKDRRKAGMCASACGLYLKDVFYRWDWLLLVIFMVIYLL